MKKTILIIIIISTFSFINILSHHVESNYNMIASITYISYLNNSKDKQYTSVKDIKNIENKIRKINFYHINSDKPLQESPTMSIIIKFKDGSRKNIDIVGCHVLISDISQDGILSGDFYYVNPYEVRWYME